MACAAQIIAGGLLSNTTMVRLQEAVFPQSSVAVHVRVTLYVPGHDPWVVTSLKVMATLASHASVAVGATHDGVAGQLIGVL